MNEVIETLKKVGAILTDDHFVGTSGLHLSNYILKDALFPHTSEVSKICKLFAEKYKDQNIEVVVAPAIGGIILSQWVAHHLSQVTGREVLGVFTEKTADNDQVFKRGYEKYVSNKRVLVLEDNTTTGGSVVKVANSVKNAGGNIVAVCVMVNRDPEHVNSKTLGIPFDSLSELPSPSYKPEECPLCKQNIPVNTVIGHGKKFLEEKNK